MSQTGSKGRAEEVAAAIRRMDQVSYDLGATLQAPFMTMSFLALSVVPI